MLTFKRINCWLGALSMLALSSCITVGEFSELAEDANKEKVKEELADVLGYSLLLAEKYGFNVKEIVLDKIQKNAKKYPVEKAKGTSKKYNEL